MRINNDVLRYIPRNFANGNRVISLTASTYLTIHGTLEITVVEG